jgi:hypothetical protein
MERKKLRIARETEREREREKRRRGISTRAIIYTILIGVCSTSLPTYPVETDFPCYFMEDLRLLKIIIAFYLFERAIKRHLIIFTK